jgi:hypothetical protein
MPLTGPIWEVVVGNIGTVHSGLHKHVAMVHYQTYVKQSTEPYGRTLSSGESVTLVCDGEIVLEHTPPERVPVNKPLKP